MVALLIYFVVLCGSCVNAIDILPAPPGIDPVKHLTDSLNNLTAVVENLKQDVASLQALIGQNREVAFFARLVDTSNIVLGIKQTLVYNDIVTNIGNGYDLSDGEFAAPVGGTYQFNVAFLGPGGEGSRLAIVKNGNLVSVVYSAADDGDLGTQIIVLHMNVGDKLWVRNDGDAGTHVYSPRPYNTFSGFKLN